MAIARGATPTHTFTTDIDLTGTEVLYITYEQQKKEILEKTKEDCEIEADKINVKLTQEDTLKFDPKYKVYMQIRPRWPDGTALISNIMVTDVATILKEGVI